MSAGTITLTNKSKSITGVNTTFNTDLSPGDFIVVTVGGIPYTLPVDTVNTNTSITLVSEYPGPTQAGAAWYAVPRVAQNMITAALVAQGAEALRGLNYDKQNWQQLFSSDSDITVKIPDNSQYTGPSWLKLSQALSSKANQEDVNESLSLKANREDSLLKVNNKIFRIGVNAVVSINDGLYRMSFLTSGGPIGAYNQSIVGGVTYYTHYYKIPLPQVLPNGIISGVATIIADRFDQQNAGYPTDVKLTRDKEGGGLSTTYVTVSVRATAAAVGWTPYIHIDLVGY